MLVVLNEFKVLDALLREISVRKKRGEEDPRAQYTVLLNRLLKENDDLKESSARTQTSRYLKELYKYGYVEREKIGRNVFYDVTGKGRFYHISNRDRLDKSREWHEDPHKGILYSYAIVPSAYGLIHETHDHNKELVGKEKLQEAIKEFKEKNPDLESIIIRLEE
jgi:hypothetical protein